MSDSWRSSNTQQILLADGAKFFGSFAPFLCYIAAP